MGYRIVNDVLAGYGAHKGLEGPLVRSTLAAGYDSLREQIKALILDGLVEEIK